MSVDVEFSISSDSFLLGRMFELDVGVQVGFCRTVSTGQGLFPQFWLVPANAENVVATLRDHPETDSLTRLTVSDGIALYAASWNLSDDALVVAIRDADGTVVRATGTPTTWSFRLRFPTRSGLRQFNERCRAREVEVQVHRVGDAVPESDHCPLSISQWTALVEAYHRGYFEVPRRISQTELATVLGVSDSAVSQRLRRGVAALVADSLFARGEDGRPGPSHGVGGGPS